METIQNVIAVLVLLVLGGVIVVGGITMLQDGAIIGLGGIGFGGALMYAPFSNR